MANTNSTHHIDNINTLSLDNFLIKYLQSDDQWSSFTHPLTGTRYGIELQTSRNLLDDELSQCFSLIEQSSKSDYSASKVGWKPISKRKEMRLLDLKYLLVRAADPPNGEDKGRLGDIEAFVSFMPTIEDDQQVLYVYEIHLAPSLRRSGLGKQLMSLVERMARRMAVEKVMLTCFTRNVMANRFYDGIGYEKDEFSPLPRVLRDGRVVEEAYVILSKKISKIE